MIYQQFCIFNPKRMCPIWKQAGGIELDGLVCQACVDVTALEGAFKAQVISRLLITFHDEKKAKEAFDEIMRCVKEW